MINNNASDFKSFRGSVRNSPMMKSPMSKIRFGNLGQHKLLSAQNKKAHQINFEAKRDEMKLFTGKNQSKKNFNFPSKLDYVERNESENRSDKRRTKMRNKIE